MTDTGTPHAAVGPADLDTRLLIYRRMVQIRRFEQEAYDLFIRGLVRGTTHLALGQEAVAAGFAAAMHQDDYSFATYRGHSHLLARGAPMAATMGELIGRANGINGGRGGSMHLTSARHGMLGSYAIVGAHLPVAAGAAWSAQVRRSGQVAICFFGDGATNTGAFHEALNIAAVWKLPVVFVCENNYYMEYTPIMTVTSVPNPAADRAASYGLERIDIDGNDADLVFATAARTIDRARRGDGPSLVEAKTYRHGGHSRADPATYRPQAEVEEWLARDPIPRYRERLVDDGVPMERLEQIDAEVADMVKRATDDAIASPPPAIESIATGLWADGGATWRN